MRRLSIYTLALTILFPEISVALDYDHIKVEIAGNSFTVEVADTPKKRTRGLMFRKALGKNRGMLFIHPESDYFSYWMKNCLINLDLIFINSEKKIVHIFHNVPPCHSLFCQSYKSPIRAMYVLEISGGTSKKLKLRRGMKVKFP